MHFHCPGLASNTISQYKNGASEHTCEKASVRWDVGVDILDMEPQGINAGYLPVAYVTTKSWVGLKLKIVIFYAYCT